jgi:hypothetical protein
MAQTLHEILTSKNILVQDKGLELTVRTPEILADLKSGYDGDDLQGWFSGLKHHEQVALIQKGLAQVIIDLRACARGNKNQSLTDGLAQKRVDSYRLKPQEEPKGTSKKRKQTLPEVIAELREAGKSEEEIIALVTKLVAGK